MDRDSRTIAVLLLLSIALAAVCSATVCASQYPDKPIRMVVPMAAGGGVDIMARLVGEKLMASWSQPVVIDNRGGGGGSIAPEMVAKAPPDGYTLLYISLSNVLNTLVYSGLPYDLLKDFAPVTQVAAHANILVVIPTLPVKSVKELIAIAKAKPGQLNYASDGKGSYTHVAMELFKSMAGIDMVHIPYKGSAPSMVDMFAGRVEVKIATVSVLPQIRAGRLRALGVSSPERIPAAPDLPPIQEQLPGFVCMSWHGILAPGKTPPNTIKQLNGEITRILQSAEIKNRLISEGSQAVGTSPQQFGDFLKQEKAKWGKVIAGAGIRTD